MSIISRITNWGTQILTSSALNGEFNNIVNVLNNLDSDASQWTNVDATTAFKFNGNTILTIQQVVAATSSGDAAVTSATYVATNLTTSITPKSTSSKILVMSVNNFSCGNLNDETNLAQFRGATQLTSLVRFTSYTSGPIYTATMLDYDSPASVAAQTYTIKIKNSGPHAVTHYGTSNMILVEFL